MTRSNMLPDENAYVPSGWPERIIELAGRWRPTDGDEPRDAMLSELWILLNAALAKYVRVHRARHGRVSEDDVRDIASDKSLELIRKFNEGTWTPADSHPGQLCTFISTVARNGLVDCLRAHHGMRGLDTAGDPEYAHRHEVVDRQSGRSFEFAPDREQFASVILECSRRLNPRLRLIWYLRSFLEMPSKMIAAHPAVRMTPASVDVVLVRARNALRKCMKRKGFVPGDLPQGAFVATWEALRSDVRGEEGEMEV